MSFFPSLKDQMRLKETVNRLTPAQSTLTVSCCVQANGPQQALNGLQAGLNPRAGTGSGDLLLRETRCCENPFSHAHLSDLDTPVQQPLGPDVVFVVSYVVQQASIRHQLSHQLD